MWNHKQPIPQDIARNSPRLIPEGAWGGASWDGILNPGMYVFKQRFQESIVDKQPGKGFFYLNPYDPELSVLARDEIDFLFNKLQNFKTIVDIQHVGSTAVPFIDAKPIIDLMVGITNDDDLDELYKAVFELGYGRRNRWAETNYPFLSKYLSNKLAFSLIFVKFDSLYWKSRLDFRDYLIAYPGEAKIYSEMKKKIINSGVCFTEYVLLKQKFFYECFLKMDWSVEDMIEATIINKDPNDVSMPIPKIELFNAIQNSGGQDESHR